MLKNLTRTLVTFFAIIFFISTPLKLVAQILPGAGNGSQPSSGSSKKSQSTTYIPDADDSDPVVVTLNNGGDTDSASSKSKKSKSEEDDSKSDKFTTKSYLGGYIGFGLGALGNSVSEFFSNFGSDFSNPRMNVSLGIFYEIRPYKFFSFRLEFSYQQLFLMHDEGSVASGSPIIMGSINPGIRFYLGCPFYLGAGGNFGVASSTSTTAYTGFYVELGYLIPIAKSAAIDIGLRYNFYPPNSSVAQYLSQNDPTVSSFHTFNLILGFSAVL